MVQKKVEIQPMKKPFLSLVILALIAPFAVAAPRDDAAVALALAKAKRTVAAKPAHRCGFNAI
jgi:hypothetical protein